jgi:hypothetical protein
MSSYENARRPLEKLPLENLYVLDECSETVCKESIDYWEHPSVV